MEKIIPRGRKFVGVVVSAKTPKTVIVRWERLLYNKKYERYEKRFSKVAAHDELGAKEGDVVEIMESRPISKTKRFIVTKIIKKAGE